MGSNEWCLTFEHTLTIPNVFTPNDDGINDFFEILKIELFPDNELTIINKYGKTAFQEKSYKNQWNALDLPPGIYYYSLETYRNKKNFKGWVQVLR